MYKHHWDDNFKVELKVKLLNEYSIKNFIVC